MSPNKTPACGEVPTLRHGQTLAPWPGKQIPNSSLHQIKLDGTRQGSVGPPGEKLKQGDRLLSPATSLVAWKIGDIPSVHV